MNEIERKFLVNNLPDLTEYPFKEIEQCYIKRNPELRIRKSNNDYFITKKSDGTIKREEIETTINNTTYELLQSLIIGNLIKKTRFIIPLSDTLTAELDIYKGALKGLITVEVEFSSLKKANSFIKPSWFGEEITSNINYKNKNLSMLTKEKIASLIKKNSN